MAFNVGRIMRMVKRDRILESAARRDRAIPQSVYIFFKRKKFCDRCGVKKSVKPLEIHHIIPKSLGGSNDKGNLMAVCVDCHKILDSEVKK